jgi:hypothetical protein
VPTYAVGEIEIDKVIASYDGQKGVLYFTNRRLVFEYTQGLVNKKFFQMGVALPDIQSVRASHPRLSWSELVIRTQNSRNGFEMNEIIINTAMNSEMWVKKINQVLMSRDSSEARPHLVVEKEVVRVPCKYCGSIVNASSEHCPQCGAPL